MAARIVVSRRAESAAATGGILTLEVHGQNEERGETVFKCRTLELPWRNNKTSVSRIPPGEYDLLYRNYGRFFQRYKKKWAHEFIPEVARVPSRTAILIHTGNYPAHTHGCILVGKKGDARRVLSSATAYCALIAAMKEYRPETILIADDFDGAATPEKKQ